MWPRFAASEERKVGRVSSLALAVRRHGGLARRRFQVGSALAAGEDTSGSSPAALSFARQVATRDAVAQGPISGSDGRDGAVSRHWNCAWDPLAHLDCSIR